ncbi:prepilin-type N-terminal cleavage/methylation domain-containing protein [Tuwongella immobilis]|uniref:Type II secretion system protein n=1 Tax=Tuwongella immobilis TaxID=692036 RepID=A0A6C2YK03_9BACT|nr:prepilin-type N-terminal cleavage/methylation domain-containing protein [Tuwongella immobilis]VIP01559.1 Uncharacterized protein OS=Planctomyces limnophilus (strain ATCC 43296 / DSM 3776 / IFAM 1008 / 290) GN=Plim_0404 PE=4 SV=1 [Tuwongella immobilis]VTR98768.1 Uncharacterized protein OS=Planctomyces limnophilus (strain ATCC 43296 / DSM 3776 / IFAM 1008 / 290) GN=Plim_0404 PE=4 SV=1 [Tuwongella immobilis]
MRTHARIRPGFTLVELIVVISIIGTIAGAVLLMVPSLDRQGRAARGADQLQGWLLIAKQQALRDQRPRGLRMITDPSNPGRITQLEYIEEPEPYVPPKEAILSLFFQGGQYRGTLSNPTTPGISMAPEVVSALQPGDWLEIQLSGTMYRITAVDAASGLISFESNSKLDEIPTNGKAMVLSNGFQFIRALRPMVGEDPLTLPKGVFINMATSQMPARDIVFSPSGQLVGQSLGRTIIWVQDEEDSGPPTLICIYGRTGQIAAHPVSSSGDPYEFTRDGKSSGL